jgi:hypothetical protein
MVRKYRVIRALHSTNLYKRGLASPRLPRASHNLKPPLYVQNPSPQEDAKPTTENGYVARSGTTDTSTRAAMRQTSAPSEARRPLAFDGIY